MREKTEKIKIKNRTAYPRTVGQLQRAENACNGEREKAMEVIFEVVMTEKVPQINVDTKLQIQEAQKTLNRINAKQTNQ